MLLILKYITSKWAVSKWASLSETCFCFYLCFFRNQTSVWEKEEYPWNKLSPFRQIGSKPHTSVSLPKYSTSELFNSHYIISKLSTFLFNPLQHDSFLSEALQISNSSQPCKHSNPSDCLKVRVYHTPSPHCLPDCHSIFLDCIYALEEGKRHEKTKEHYTTSWVYEKISKN